jgi:hypothetical protein
MSDSEKRIETKIQAVNALSFYISTAHDQWGGDDERMLREAVDVLLDEAASRFRAQSPPPLVYRDVDEYEGMAAADAMIFDSQTGIIYVLQADPSGYGGLSLRIDRPGDSLESMPSVTNKNSIYEIWRAMSLRLPEREFRMAIQGLERLERMTVTTQESDD